jgi:hypothetical protein
MLSFYILIKNKMDSIYPLPGKRIDIGGTLYFIHGIVHDTPLVSIPQSFKRVINEKFRGYNVICEDGFTEWIENAISFDEISHFKFDKISFFDILRTLFAVNYIRFTKKKPPIAQKVQEMRSLEDFNSIREELFRDYQSEPAGMNSLISRLGKGTLENPQGELPLRIKRYAYEAKQSLNHSRNNQLRELHIVVGCAHELPLEYLLKNRKLLDNLNP